MDKVSKISAIKDKLSILIKDVEELQKTVNKEYNLNFAEIINVVFVRTEVALLYEVNVTLREMRELNGEYNPYPAESLKKNMEYLELVFYKAVFLICDNFSKIIGGLDSVSIIDEMEEKLIDLKKTINKY